MNIINLYFWFFMVSEWLIYVLEAVECIEESVSQRGFYIVPLTCFTEKTCRDFNCFQIHKNIVSIDENPYNLVVKTTVK